MSVELERALRSLEVDWPATPDIATAIRPRLEERRARTGLAPLSRRRIAAAVVIAVTGLTAAIEPARSAVLELLGLKGAKIERREPDAPPPPTRRVGSLGRDLLLGRAVTLEEAHRTVDFTAAPPSVLGEPDAVYVDESGPAGGRVSYVYRPQAGLPESQQTGVGLLVMEFKAVVEPYIEKAAGPGTKIERLTVDGDPGFFLSGAPHGFAFAESHGAQPFFEDQRLAGNTLLLERDGLLLRIEGEIGRGRALEIAESITATSQPPTGS